MGSGIQAAGSATKQQPPLAEVIENQGQGHPIGQGHFVGFKVIKGTLAYGP